MAQQFNRAIRFKKLRPGVYVIAGKKVFVRILRQACSWVLQYFALMECLQHVMVRVGGGWDTLLHYLESHERLVNQSVTLLASLMRSRQLREFNESLEGEGVAEASALENTEDAIRNIDGLEVQSTAHVSGSNFRLQQLIHANVQFEFTKRRTGAVVPIRVTSTTTSSAAVKPPPQLHMHQVAEHVVNQSRAAHDLAAIHTSDDIGLDTSTVSPAKAPRPSQLASPFLAQPGASPRKSFQSVVRLAKTRLSTDSDSDKRDSSESRTLNDSRDGEMQQESAQALETLHEASVEPIGSETVSVTVTDSDAVSDNAPAVVQTSEGIADQSATQARKVEIGTDALATETAAHVAAPKVDQDKAATSVVLTDPSMGAESSSDPAPVHTEVVMRKPAKNADKRAAVMSEFIPSSAPLVHKSHTSKEAPEHHVTAYSQDATRPNVAGRPVMAAKSSSRNGTHDNTDKHKTKPVPARPVHQRPVSAAVAKHNAPTHTASTHAPVQSKGAAEISVPSLAPPSIVPASNTAFRARANSASRPTRPPTATKTSAGPSDSVAAAPSRKEEKLHATT